MSNKNYVSAEDAYTHMTSGQGSGAQAARERMLQRMGLKAKDQSAEAARKKMLSHSKK